MQIDGRIRKCKWCQQDVFLCKSHAIPKYFGEDMKKEHRPIPIDPRKNPVLYCSPSDIHEPNNWHRQDIFKARILCKDCEQRFRKLYDDPANALWNKWGKQIQSGARIISVSEEEWATCEHFILSVIWRSLFISECKLKIGKQFRRKIEGILAGKQIKHSLKFRIQATMRGNKLFKSVVTPGRYYIGLKPRDYDRGIGFLAGGFSWECLTSVWQPLSDKAIAKDYLDFWTYSSIVLEATGRADVIRNQNANTPQAAFIRSKFPNGW